MQSGLLTGTFDMNALAPDDWRHNSEKFKEPKYSRGLRAVERLRPIARKYSKTVGQLAIAWVLMHQTITSAIVGARRKEQIEQDIGGGGWVIGEGDMKSIDELLNEHS
jgi:aryl-alcohol dehydrogenase-like predicted oxidoreductase